MLHFSPTTELEAQNAFDWYEQQRAGLGEELIDEFMRVVVGIVEAPTRPRVFYRGLRKVRLSRFPYAVFYLVADSEIVITGLIHGARHPMSWQRRA